MSEIQRHEEQSLRSKVENLERAMEVLPQVDIPVENGFGPGFYHRAIFIPAGTALTGKVHKTEHIFMVTKGDISLLTDEGMKRVQAPYQAVCKPGMKRAGYAHTDTVCVNIHITNETDLAKLESELIVAEALEAPAETKEIT